MAMIRFLRTKVIEQQLVADNPIGDEIPEHV
jgi:hypothetical protein